MLPGDRVHKIQAVLSGSLNFVFNNFNETSSFKEVVSQAKEEGYTEPDPRIDLSGIDVARKILILARESGYPIEIEDIENHTFLPKESLETPSVESFIESLETHAVHFNQLYMAAKEEDKRLKYVQHLRKEKPQLAYNKP